MACELAVALGALLMAALMFSVGRQLHLWLMIPLAGMVYAALVIWLRAFAPEEIDVFARIWRRVVLSFR